jgi:hypothetical protein
MRGHAGTGLRGVTDLQSTHGRADSLGGGGGRGGRQAWAAGVQLPRTCGQQKSENRVQKQERMGEGRD